MTLSVLLVSSSAGVPAPVPILRPCCSCRFAFPSLFVDSLRCCRDSAWSGRDACPEECADCIVPHIFTPIPAHLCHHTRRLVGPAWHCKRFHLPVVVVPSWQFVRWPRRAYCFLLPSALCPVNMCLLDTRLGSQGGRYLAGFLSTTLGRTESPGSSDSGGAGGAPASTLHALHVDRNGIGPSGFIAIMSALQNVRHSWLQGMWAARTHTNKEGRKEASSLPLLCWS